MSKENFIEDIKAVMKKHNAIINSVEYYDEAGGFLDHTYYFAIGKQSYLADDDNFSVNLGEINDE